jgi:hypothetical protein
LREQRAADLLLLVVQGRERGWGRGMGMGWALERVMEREKLVGCRDLQ